MPDVSCVECYNLVDAPLEYNGLGPLCRRCYREISRHHAYAAAQARIAQLESELAEARRDSARLDWLEQNRYGIFPGMPRIKHDYWAIRTYWPTHPIEAERDTIRLTIDAAMEPHAH